MDGALAANLAVGAAVLLAGLSLLLAALGFLSYSRVRHGRLVWVALAFAAFAAKGALLAWWAYGRRLDIAEGTAPELLTLALFDLGIVLALYLAVLKR